MMNNLLYKAIFTLTKDGKKKLETTYITLLSTQKHALKICVKADL